MNVHIKETNEKKVLSMIDPISGTDYVKDFIGNHGALSDGQFTWDDVTRDFLVNQDTFIWWNDVITKQNDLTVRIAALKEEHGSEIVDTIVCEASDVDLEDEAAAVNKALDEKFGVIVEK